MKEIAIVGLLMAAAVQAAHGLAGSCSYESECRREQQIDAARLLSPTATGQFLGTIQTH